MAYLWDVDCVCHRVVLRVRYGHTEGWALIGRGCLAHSLVDCYGDFALADDSGWHFVDLAVVTLVPGIMNSDVSRVVAFVYVRAVMADDSNE